MADGLDRRGVLALGGVALAAGAAPALATVPAVTAGGVLVFDPASPEAREMAERAHGVRLVALAGDPVRFWRDTLGDHRGPVSGFTRWSDYLVLRGLAEERGLRLRDEQGLPVATGAMIVHWRMG